MQYVLRYATTVSSVTSLQQNSHAHALHRLGNRIYRLRSLHHSTSTDAIEPFCLLTKPTTATASEGPDNIKEVALLELGPVLVHEEELRVRKLPQKKVAEPVLAGRADQNVWIWTVRRQERILEFLFGDVVG